MTSFKIKTISILPLNFLAYPTTLLITVTSRSGLLHFCIDRCFIGCIRDGSSRDGTRNQKERKRPRWCRFLCLSPRITGSVFEILFLFFGTKPFILFFGFRFWLHLFVHFCQNKYRISIQYDIFEIFCFEYFCPIFGA